MGCRVLRLGGFLPRIWKAQNLAYFSVLPLDVLDWQSSCSAFIRWMQERLEIFISKVETRETLTSADIPHIYYDGTSDLPLDVSFTSSGFIDGKRISLQWDKDQIYEKATPPQSVFSNNQRSTDYSQPTSWYPPKTKGSPTPHSEMVNETLNWSCVACDLCSGVFIFDPCSALNKFLSNW